MGVEGVGIDMGEGNNGRIPAQQRHRGAFIAIERQMGGTERFSYYEIYIGCVSVFFYRRVIVGGSFFRNGSTVLPITGESMIQRIGKAHGCGTSESAVKSERQEYYGQTEHKEDKGAFEALPHEFPSEPSD